MSLVLCAACERHVRAAERVCPFCDAARTVVPRELAPFRATSRAAVLFFTASLAACGKKSADPEIATSPAAPVASAEDRDAAIKAMIEQVRDAGPETVAVYGPAPINSNTREK